MAMVAKTSLESKHLRKHYYFAITTSRSHTILLEKHVTNGMLGAPLKKIKRRKDLQKRVHVVVIQP